MNLVFADVELLENIKNLTQFPFGQICKHRIMLDLLQMMELKGFDLTSHTDLVKAVSDADDELIQKLINQLINKLTKPQN